MRPEIAHDLVIFVKIVEKNGFTAAAKELGLSKSMVSKHLSRLEANLGSQLLNRSTRKLSLTEIGQVIYTRSQGLLADVEELQYTASHAHSKPHGTIRMASSLGFGHLHLPAVIKAFTDQYPDVQVQLLLGRSHADLIENGLDVAIQIGQLYDSALIARRLSTRPMRVCASPGYLKKQGYPRKPDDLINHNCLRHDHSPTGNEWHFKSSGSKKRIKINGNFSSNSGQALVAAAVASLGVVMLPGYLMTSAIQKGELTSLLEAHCLANIDIHVVYPQSGYLPLKTRVFIDFLVDYFAAAEYWDTE